MSSEQAEMPIVRRRARRDPLGVILAVFAVLLIAFILLPIVAVVVVSFSSATFIAFPIPGFSLRWYWRIIEYQPFMQSLGVSIVLALCSATLGAALGVPAALALARSRSAAASAIAGFLLSPISIPAIVLGFALLYYLAALHLGVSFTALLVAHTVVSIPYISRTVLAVYRSVPGALEEAASVLGANRWQVLRHVTLPLVRPGIFAGCMFAVLISFDNLSLSFFFGTSGSITLPVVMLSYMETQFDPSIAAISTVQMLIAIIALLALDRVYGIEKLTSTS